MEQEDDLLIADDDSMADQANEPDSIVMRPMHKIMIST